MKSGVMGSRESPYKRSESWGLGNHLMKDGVMVPRESPYERSVS